MDQTVLIDVNKVSKRYCRDLKRSLWYGVRDVAKELMGQSQEEHNLRKDEFWGLKEVSFRLGKGESLGLIGRNGAGKTTLLKLIHGLIKPTGGRITVNGSIRALIALGTGFNPILTGRENIRISGAILGYTEKEMNEKFDEIVEFSEIGDFIDSPVQSYSSGMLARLAFSVAVHTNPDIMLVDEVLAVGDLNFAIKCYRKIVDYLKQGGSMILVSHNMYTIRTNCTRAIWLDQGTIKTAGETNEVCDTYELFAARTDKVISEQRYLDNTIEITEVNYPQSILDNDSFWFEFTIKTRRNIKIPIVAVSIFDITGHNLITNISSLDNFTPFLKDGQAKIRVRYDKLYLGAGAYHINLVLADGHINNQLAAFINCFKFEVKSNFSNFGAGFFKLQPKWESQ
ncbi:MAG: ABC transporter ATP-binding protein [Planctomycetota bacterium]